MISLCNIMDSGSAGLRYTVSKRMICPYLSGACRQRLSKKNKSSCHPVSYLLVYCWVD